RSERGGRRTRQACGFVISKNPTDVAGRALALVKETRPIGDQAAGGDKGAIEVDRGQLVPRRQREDQITVSVCKRVWRYDQAADRGVRKGCDGALDLSGVAHVDRDHLHPERRRYGLDDTEQSGAAGIGGVAERPPPRPFPAALFLT